MQRKLKRTPWFPRVLLGWLLSADEYAEFIDDIGELYDQLVEEKGERKANAWYWFRSIESIPGILWDQCYWRWIMVNNYLKTAVRNIKSRKIFSIINVAGLSIGLAVSILIFMYVLDELTYDRCHGNKNIYRIGAHIETPNRQMDAAMAPGPLGPTLVREYPEVLRACRLRIVGERILSYGDNLFRQNGLLYADPDVTEFFKVETLQGNPTSFLEAPFSLIVTDELAVKLFGEADPLGKMIRVNDEHEYTITGVVKRMPGNSHFKFNGLFSMSTLSRLGNWTQNPDAWVGFNFSTYIELQDEVDLNTITEKATILVREETASWLEKLNLNIDLVFQPLQSIHLHSRMEGELEPGGNLNLIRTFMIIGFFILLIASINFMNLSTAQSVKRAKEVGVRKVCGAGRRRIIFQFLSESVFLTFISLFLACGLVRLLLPLFNLLTNKTLSLQFAVFWPFLIMLPALALFVGAFSGLYPALFLSSYTPVEVLKKKVRGGKGQRTFRNILVHLQYAISIALIFCTLVIALQLRHFRNHSLGFDHERVISIPLSGAVREKFDVFREEVNRLPGLELSSVSSNVPGWGRSETMFAFEGIETIEPYVFPFTDTDEAYVSTMGLSLVSGRNFSKVHSSDRRSILVNETLVNMLGWESPLGKRVTMTDVRGGGEFVQLEYIVIGVVGDFHFESLHSPIRPHLIRLLDAGSGSGYSDPGFLSVRREDGILTLTLEQIQEIWNDIEPARPFEYRFLADVFHEQYENEQHLGNLFIGFTGLAIFIACLGLFGLSSFIAEQRTKEIGIRKVLGASIPSVVLMLSREFSKWVLLANILAWPVAYYAMHRWLLQFAYRIDIGLWMFFVSGITALLIALSTVWFQTIKVAMGNPVVSLRYE